MTDLVTAEPVSTIKPKAAIIDDAFDDVAEIDVPFASFKKFYLREENQFLEILQDLKIEMPDMYDLEDNKQRYLEFIDRIWKARNDKPELKNIINHKDFFKNKLDNLKELEDLCNNLRDQHLEIATFKSNISTAETFKENDFAYIFIDYNLGVTPGKEARERARNVATEIYKSYPEGKKPMTILMSNEPNIVSKREEFKEQAGLLQGVFRVSPKEDLTDKTKVSLLAKAFLEASESNDALQDYVNSLITASEQAQESFKKEVRELSIDDYNFLQDSRLFKQQHPLGDYLAFLYGSLWLNLLLTNEKLKPTQKQLDGITAVKSPMHESLPSLKLSEIFTIALFESDLDEINYHPWEGKAKDIAKLKFLHLGDILTKPKSTEVFMVLNPQCDLERPTAEKLSQSIYLLPGKLQPFDQKISASAVRTELFNFEKKRFRIYWQLKEVKTIPLHKFERWTKICSLQRKHRLRLNYALEIQQKFTSHMSRVGVPVAPPIINEISVTLLYKDWQKGSEYKEIWTADDIAVITTTHKNEHVVRPTLKLGLDLKSNLSKTLIDLEGQLEQYADKKPDTLTKRIESLKKFLEKFNNWFFEKKEFPLAGESKSEWLENGVIVTTFKSNIVEDKFASVPFWLSFSVKEKAIDTDLETELETRG